MASETDWHRLIGAYFKLTSHQSYTFLVLQIAHVHGFM